MAYNNGFPVGYQPAQFVYPQNPQNYPQPVQQAAPVQQPMQQQMQNNPMIWVQGETGAKSYLLSPNTTLPLWDSEAQVIYLKSSDASGMPSMKILDYTIRDTSLPQNQVQIMEEPKTEYVTKEEFAKFEKDIKTQFKALKKGAKEDAE